MYFEERERVMGETHDIPICHNSTNSGDECAGYAHFDSSRWPNGTIPYMFSHDFTTKDQELILAMMDKIQEVSCIQFKQATSEATYIDFQRRRDNGPCESFIGYKNNGPRHLLLQEDCMTRNGILHELMHALGFRHEHLRSDRDKYVTINMSNVKKEKQEMFKKRNFSERVLDGIIYDVNSVLHYPYNAFAIDATFPTIVAKSGENIIANGLSRKDILKINRLYDCGRKTDSISCGM